MKFAKCLFALLAVVLCLGFAYNGEAKAGEYVYGTATIKRNGSPIANGRYVNATLYFTYLASQTAGSLNDTQVTANGTGAITFTFYSDLAIDWSKAVEVTILDIEGYEDYYYWSPHNQSVNPPNTSPARTAVFGTVNIYDLN